MTWNPSLYMSFSDERTRPAADLLAHVPLSEIKSVVDLGCGAGNSTALLVARYPNADVLGVDSSADMLTQARATGSKARWAQGDFDDWAPEAPCDLIYANAAFHWSRDPMALVARLFAALTPSGALAFQVPQNFDQPSHIAIREAAAHGSWAEKLGTVREAQFIRAADVVRKLAPLGAALDVWTTEYLHQLQGPDPVLRWIGATAMRPYLQRLDESERPAFEDAVRTRLAREYPPEPDGRTLFPFRRLFVVAQKAASAG